VVASLTTHPQYYYFARDDRLYSAFVERYDRNKSQIQRTCNRRLRWQLGILRESLEGRSTTYRVRFVSILRTSSPLIALFQKRKVELLTQQLDEGEGR